MKGKTLFLSDLDGTLLGGDSKLSPETADMLNKALGNGALFSVATARTPSTVSFLLEDVCTTLPFIVMTGAAIWEPKSGDYLHKVTMHPEVAAKVYQTIKKHRLPAFVYTLSGKVIDIYHYGPLSELEKNFISERDESPFKRFHIPESGTSEISDPLCNVMLFYTMQPSALVEATYRDMLAVEGCNPVFYHDMFGMDTGIMEIFSDKASKANALQWLRRHTGAEKVVAFGDNINDIPMLRAADVAVAVENAVPEVKAIADIVIGKNTDNAVAQFILQESSL